MMTLLSEYKYGFKKILRRMNVPIISPRAVSVFHIQRM